MHLNAAVLKTDVMPNFDIFILQEKLRHVSKLSIWFEVNLQESTRYVFVKHKCPRQQQSQNMAKIYKS